MYNRGPAIALMFIAIHAFAQRNLMAYDVKDSVVKQLISNGSIFNF